MQKPRLRFVALLTALALTGGTLTACATEPPSTPEKTQAPDAAEPLFASDEEALAAAETAYTKYLAVSDAVLAGGGAETEPLREVAIGQALEWELGAARDFAAKGLYTTGTTAFQIHRLQSVTVQPDHLTEIRLYVCDDLSNTDLFNSSGVSQVAQDGQTIYPFEIAVVGTTAQELKVSEKNLWTAGGMC